MKALELQSRFVRGLERAYEDREGEYLKAGMGPETAHRRALEDAKEFGRNALNELRERGLFPWWNIGVEERDHAG